MNSARLVLTSFAVAFGVLLHGPAGAADAHPGRAAYLKYCSACHGAEGRGDGVVSSTMRPKPADLTQLAKTHGGTYPYAYVEDTIDGRQRFGAHGSSEMPVWGEILTREKSAAQHSAEVRGQVQLITGYLATIQAE